MYVDLHQRGADKRASLALARCTYHCCLTPLALARCARPLTLAQRARMELASVIHHGVLELRRLRLLVDSVLVRASGFLSPASSSLVVFTTSVVTLPSARCACRERRLLEILQRDVALSSSSLAVIMALHGSLASLHVSPCFRQAFCLSTC